MELHQVRYFVALAGSLNFTRAAEQCNVTQSALTKAIQKLERELGGELVFRERQLTQLTDLGRLVRPTLEATLAAVDSSLLHAREFQRKTVAPLRMALAPCVSASIATEPLAQIATFLPGLQVEMVEAEPRRAVSMLLDGEVNAALAGDDLDGLPPRIDAWNFFEERFVVLATRDHEMASMPEVPLEALGRAQWLDHLGCEAVQRFWQARALHGCPARIVHRSRNMHHLQHMVEADLGVMLAPEHVPRLESLAARGIVGDPLTRTVRLLVVSGRRYSPALDAFVKVARTWDWRARWEGRRSVDEGVGARGVRSAPRPDQVRGGSPLA